MPGIFSFGRRRYRRIHPAKTEVKAKKGEEKESQGRAKEVSAERQMPHDQFNGVAGERKPVTERRVKFTTQRSLPKAIDSGMQVRLSEDRTRIIFESTEASVQADAPLSAEASSREQVEAREECLAAGANGYVQRCTVNNQPAVVKRPYSLDSGQSYLDASGFAKEAGVLLGLKMQTPEHAGFQNLVPFLGAGVSNKGEPLIFLAPAEQNLAQLMRREKIPLPRIISLGKDLFSGLSCLADFNLCHQDIKTANLLLKDGRLWLADFGEAVSSEGFASLDVLGEKVALDKLRCGTGEGKPFFGSYELPIPAQDVWSAGLVMAEMLNPKGFPRFLKELNSQPFAGGPVSAESLTPEQESRLRQHCEQVLDSFLEDSLTGPDRAYQSAFKELLLRMFDPVPNSRIPATEAVRALDLYQKTILSPEAYQR